MTLIQLLHHAEQMEAYRRDFNIAYAPVKRRLAKLGTPRAAMADFEWQAWRAWIQNRMDSNPS